MAINYTSVTEVPRNKITREQLERMYTRYCFAAEFCNGKDVLEVACGPGIGLGYLAKTAKKVVGGDYSEDLLRIAKEHYRGKLELLCLDAHELPFNHDSFDVVILYEAIYYLEKPGEFIDECHRILRKDGLIIICTVNKDWSDFNPSPFSTQYFSAPELSALLEEHDLNVEFFGGCPVAADSVGDKVISAIKRAAVTLHLMPKTMKVKEVFKRVFFGKLLSLEAELDDGIVEYSAPVLIPGDISNMQYKVLYAIAYV